MSRLGRLFLSNPDFAVKAYVIVPHDYLDKVSTKIVELGVLEVVTPEKRSEYEREVREIAEYYNLLEKARRLYEELALSVEEETTIEIRYEPRPGELKDLVKRLTERLEHVASEVRGLNDLIAGLKSEVEEVELVKQMVMDVASRHPNADSSLIGYRGAEIVVETFIGSSEGLAQLQQRAVYAVSFVSKGDRACASLVFYAKDYDKVLAALPKGVERVGLGEAYGLRPLREIVEDLDKRLENLRSRLAEAVARKKATVKGCLEDLALLKVVLDLEYERVRAVHEAMKSHFLTVIIGWVAQTKVGQVEGLAKEYPVQVVFEESPEPPSDFNNLKPFKPFELITEMNGAPAKSDWDPTPLLTYAFALFFGLMMADVGYSIGLILATKYVLPLFVEDPKSEGVRRLQRILYVAGVSGIAVGVLSKSFFGDLLGKYIPLQQPLINTLDASQLIVMSLVIGWIWIFLSHALALAKSIIKLRNVYGALAELSILVIMVLGTLVILRIMYVNKMIERIDFIENNYSLINAMLVTSIAVLIFSKVKAVGPLGAILWIFDVVGILGDVFSFIRIAGIALGTAILAYIFNTIIGGATAINIALGVLAAAGLHFFAFAISPISPFVHSLRLCMLEISSKFYEGMNRRISPLRISIPSRLAIGTRKSS